jgi:hypothetical protein
MMMDFRQFFSSSLLQLLLLFFSSKKNPIHQELEHTL